LGFHTSLPSLFSQNAELGVTLGGTAYRGDIEVRPNTALQQMRPMAGLFYRYHTSNRWAFRGQLAFAQLRADEKHYPVASVDNWREKRGVSFTTSMIELSILPELRLFQVRDVDFYVFGGVSGFHFKPTTDYNEPNIVIGDKNLDKNATYSNFSWAIPMGVGMQWFVNDRTALGFEASGRKAFTD
jgi:hypothetical protein